MHVEDLLSLYRLLGAERLFYYSYCPIGFAPSQDHPSLTKPGLLRYLSELAFLYVTRRMSPQ